MSVEGPKFIGSILCSRQTEIVRSPELTQHNGIVIVTGVSGVGKDHLIQQALARLQPEPAINVGGYGDFLGGYFGVPKDEIKTLPADELRRGQMAALDTMKAAAPLILTSHIVAKHGSGYETNYELERALNPYKYVVVRSSPEQIHEWRVRNQGERKRSLEDLENIFEHQERIIETVDSLSRQNRSGLIVIDNINSRVKANTRMHDYNVGLLARIFQTIQYPIHPFA